MGRFRGSITKQSRREGINLAETEKVQKYLDKRPYAPGQHGQRRGRGRPSDYSVRLREKQKLARLYGMGERQFRNLFEEAASVPGVTGTVFLQLLERRLDNVVYRAGLAATRPQARQFVNHGHFDVNGKRVTIPSYRVRVGDKVSLRTKSRDMVTVQWNKDVLDRQAPGWLETGDNGFAVTVRALPEREQIDVPVREQLIVELYSK